VVLPATEFSGQPLMETLLRSAPFALSDYGVEVALQGNGENVRAALPWCSTSVWLPRRRPGPVEFDVGGKRPTAASISTTTSAPETPWATTMTAARPEVRQYIRDNALMWLRDYVDDLRADAITFVRNVKAEEDPAPMPDGWSLMRWINEIDGTMPGKSIAEDGAAW
jgi:1,4-alpha-glucan branching enzyme